MLGTLIKHEFKSTWRTMLGLYLITFIFTILGSLVLNSSVLHSGNKAFIIATTIILILYVLCLFALAVATIIYIGMNFYKTTYSSQGYLTHTLPVPTYQVICSKLLVSAIWMIISMAILICSVFSLMFVAAIQNGAFHDLFGNLSRVLTEINQYCHSYFHTSLVCLLLLILLLVIISCLEVCSMIFAALSVGQLFAKHRTAASIGTLVVFYILEQVTGTISAFHAYSLNVNGTSIGNVATNASDIYNTSILWAGIGQCLIYFVIFTAITLWLSSKKLNLE